MIKNLNLEEYTILDKQEIGNYIVYEALNKSNNQIVIYRERVLRDTYDLTGEYGIGYTSSGDEFYFDLEDYEKIKLYSWNVFENGYMWGYSIESASRVLMHRLVSGASNKNMIDHINHKKNDNRKSNLRIVTPSQNLMNTGMFANNTSGCKGVSWDKSRNKWMAYIKINGENKNLGRFENFEDAKRKRREAEEKLFGEYSYENSMKVSTYNG